MRRHIFNVAAAVSLMLCIATIGVWVRSHWYGIQFYRHHQHEAGVGVIGIGAARGVLTFKRSFAPGLFLGRTNSTTESVDWDVPAQMRLKLFSEANEYGFFFALRERRIDRIDSRTWLVSGVSLPLWLLTAILLVLPTTWVQLRRHYANGRGGGRCPTCGYDLRATPSRCPECGAVPAVK